MQVIQRAQDSVIYRNPNQSMSIKINERKRKLDRMHTSPAALMEEKKSESQLSVVKPDYKRRVTAMT